MVDGWMDDIQMKLLNWSRTTKIELNKNFHEEKITFE